MDYDKLENELADLIKSMIAQCRFQVSSAQARAYALEIANLVQAIKLTKETAILNKQYEVMPPHKE